MRKIIFILAMFCAFAGQAQCDSVTNLSVSSITSTGATFTATAPSDLTNVIGYRLYLRNNTTMVVTYTDNPTPLFVKTGLAALTNYNYAIFTNCNTGITIPLSNKSFTTLSSVITYTPMTANGYSFKYIKIDSGGLKLPFGDTSLGRGDRSPGSIKVFNGDSSAYLWDGRRWNFLGADLSGIIASLNLKVDSVIFRNDTLKYWVNGVSHGYLLPYARLNLPNTFSDVNTFTDNVFYDGGFIIRNGSAEGSFVNDGATNETFRAPLRSGRLAVIADIADSSRNWSNYSNQANGDYSQDGLFNSIDILGYNNFNISASVLNLNGDDDVTLRSVNGDITITAFQTIIATAEDEASLISTGNNALVQAFNAASLIGNNAYVISEQDLGIVSNTGTVDISAPLGPGFFTTDQDLTLTSTSGTLNLNASNGDVVVQTAVGGFTVNSNNDINFTSSTNINVSSPYTGILGNLVMSGTTSVFTLKGYTVATLPASPAEGSTAYVTDALAPTFLVAVVGGGAIKTPVFYNGSAWVSY